jgi:hypothetical protein
LEKKCCIYESEREIILALMEELGARSSHWCGHIGKYEDDCESCEHYHEPTRPPTEAMVNVFKGVNDDLKDSGIDVRIGITSKGKLGVKE